MLIVSHRVCHIKETADFANQRESSVSAFIVDVHVVRQVVSHFFSVPFEVFIEGSSIGRVALPPDGEKCQGLLGRANVD